MSQSGSWVKVLLILTTLRFSSFYLRLNFVIAPVEGTPLGVFGRIFSANDCLRAIDLLYFSSSYTI